MPASHRSLFLLLSCRRPPLGCVAPRQSLRSDPLCNMPLRICTSITAVPTWSAPFSRLRLPFSCIWTDLLPLYRFIPSISPWSLHCDIYLHTHRIALAACFPIDTVLYSDSIRLLASCLPALALANAASSASLTTTPPTYLPFSPKFPLEARRLDMSIVH